MTAAGILPQPTSTYQLRLDAARIWPDSVATQWIPDPSDYTRCLAWTYAGLAGAAARAAADVLAEAGLPGAHVTAAYDNGRPVITVTGADPDRVREALAGFPLTIRALP